MNRAFLADSLQLLNISITQAQMDQFEEYADFLVAYNQNVNLTAITKPDDIVTKHFVDSASVSLALSSKDIRCIDIGTGAGFPGIPLKILFPELSVTLVDSLLKRIVFLEELVKRLCLENVALVHGRAEELGRHVEYREQFDLAVSRAVTNLPALSEYCLPFVKPGGQFISMKGSEVEMANAAIKTLGGKVTEVKSVKLPYTDINHSLIIISKIQHTPSAYPRKATKITKTPIS